MNRRERHMLVATVGVVILTGIIWLVRASGGPDAPPAPPAPTGADATPRANADNSAASAGSAQPVPASARLECSLSGVRALLAAIVAAPTVPWIGDPFMGAPPVAGPHTTPDEALQLEVSGVFYSERTRGARIQGRVVFEGELIDEGVRLVGVSSEFIEVEVHGERFRIQLR